jgi:hypothetical protein
MKIYRILKKVGRRALEAFILVQLSVLPQASAVGDLALGVVIGSPTGLSLGYKLRANHSADLVLAWSGSQPLYLHGAYLWEPAMKLQIEGNSFNVYWGGGGRWITRENAFGERRNILGVRAPIGVRYKFSQPSISAYFELALNVDLVPETSVGLGGLLGLRYVF